MRSFPKSSIAFMLAGLVCLAAGAQRANARVGITIPVMTPLTVKFDEALSVKTAGNGSGFTATIKSPVQVDGVTVIPVNASAGGLVNKQSPESGELVLNSVFVNGRMYRITTSPVSVNQKASLRAGSTLTFYLVLSLNISR